EVAGRLDAAQRHPAEAVPVPRSRQRLPPLSGHDPDSLRLLAEGDAVEDLRRDLQAGRAGAPQPAEELAAEAVGEELGGDQERLDRRPVLRRLGDETETLGEEAAGALPLGALLEVPDAPDLE